MADRDQSIRFMIDLVRANQASHSVIVAAVEGLGYAGGGEVRAFLIELIEDNGVAHPVQVEAAKALGRACQV